MSDSETIDDIRERKREELLAAEDAAAEGAGDESASKQPAPAEPVHVDSESHLQELTSQYDVVLVDYYADWCGPCQMLEPIVKQIAAETTAAVAKVDVDEHPHLAQQAGVRGVPTLVFFVDGRQEERLVGMQDQATLARLVERYS